MYLGRVVGSVWCTVKTPAMTGCRMLVVQPLTPELRNTGKRLICMDCTGAGAGELVYWVRGKEASFPLGYRQEPCHDGVPHAGGAAVDAGVAEYRKAADLHGLHRSRSGRIGVLGPRQGSQFPISPG